MLRGEREGGIIQIYLTFVNQSKTEKLYTTLFLLNPLIKTYGTDEDYYFYRFHQALFNKEYSIGDTSKEFEQLFHDLLKTEHYRTITELFEVADQAIYAAKVTRGTIVA